MPESTYQQAILNEPLSENTKKERWYLLSASAVGIFMVKTGFIPTKITALGIEFSQTDRVTLLRVIAAITIYFLIAFIFYSLADYWSYRINVYFSRMASLFNRFNSLMDIHSTEFREMWNQLEEIETRKNQIQEEILEVTESALEREKDLMKNIEDLKISASTGTSNLADKKEELLKQVDDLKKELIDKQAQFEREKGKIKRELDMKKGKADVLEATAKFDETKLLVPSAKIIASLRLFFEFLIPFFISVYAIFLLLSY